MVWDLGVSSKGTGGRAATKAFNRPGASDKLLNGSRLIRYVGFVSDGWCLHKGSEDKSAGLRT